MWGANEMRNFGPSHKDPHATVYMAREVLYDWLSAKQPVANPEVKEGEAVGLHEALSWIVSLKLENVKVELDAKGVVDALSSSCDDYKDFGNLIQE
ncbi:hypothetical protein DITRI_Ditri14bG0111100 [Diplodiscus trichospermus]